MQDAGENIFLVDVREPNEYEIVSIPGSVLIPKGEFLSGAALERLPQDKRIVLHCKSGAAVGGGPGGRQERGLLRRGARGRRRARLDQPDRPIAARVLIRARSLGTRERPAWVADSLLTGQPRRAPGAGRQAVPFRCGYIRRSG